MTPERRELMTRAVDSDDGRSKLRGLIDQIANKCIPINVHLDDLDRIRAV